MNTLKRRLSYVIFLLLTTAAVPLYSTPWETNSRVAWEAAVSGITTTTFDVATGTYTPPPVNGVVPNLLSLVLDGVTFQDFGLGSPVPFAIGNNGTESEAYYNWGTGGAIFVGDVYQGSISHLHIDLPAGTLAWGSDLMLANTAGGSYTITVNGQTCVAPLTCTTAAITFPTPVFFGMTSDTTINFVDLYFSVGTRPELDNFSTASGVLGAEGEGISETPEMGSVLLCATGLIALARARQLRAIVNL